MAGAGKKPADALRRKTVLEHLVFHGKRNAIGICRELNISPQQFTDWIKGRRPIPADRLRVLAAYFSVPPGIIADEGRHTRELTQTLQVELEMRSLCALRARCLADERQVVDEKMRELERKLALQKRAERFERILGRADKTILAEIDGMLDKLESEN
jgi:DNA-binding transcriptional regulator YdaS (Cro superfamily)